MVRGAFGEQRLTSEDRIITDAAVRRFQCQRAYLRAHAGLRWMNSRSNILRGQRPTASHFAALQQVDNTLRTVCRQPQPCHCLPILSQVLTVYLGASRYHRPEKAQDVCVCVCVGDLEICKPPMNAKLCSGCFLLSSLNVMSCLRAHRSCRARDSALA